MPQPIMDPVSHQGLEVLPRAHRVRTCVRPFAWLAVVVSCAAAAPSLAQAPGSSPAAAAAARSDQDLKAEGAASEDSAATDANSTGRTLQERIRAVSRRWFLKRQRFEVEPQFGFTANDALNRAWSFGLRGSYHFNEEFAVEAGGGGGFNQELQDIRVLTADVALPKGVQQLGYADGGITFSPFYGKLALMAEQVAHFDGFISTGLGVVIDNSPSPVHPAFELGVGSRLFLSRWLTLRGDLRNYTYPVDTAGRITFQNSLIISLGVGIHFPLEFDYSSEVIGGKA